MNTLNIRFIDMFLYVSRSGAHRSMVLLPKGRGKYLHTALVQGAHLDRELVGVTVTFCYREGATFLPIAGAAKSTLAEGHRLPSLTEILGPTTSVPKSALDGPLGANLNARIVLPNGKATALRARKKDAADTRWKFPGAGELKVLLDRELTDRVRVEIPIEDRPIFAVFRSADGTETSKQLEALEQGNYYVTFLNRDTGCDDGLNPNPADYTLDEYEYLYELTNAPKTLYRYPEARYGSIEDSWEDRSNCRPICGGAECPGDPKP